MTYYPATSADFVSNATTSSKEGVTPATGPNAMVPGPANQVVLFEFFGTFRDLAATTTGVGFGIDVPPSATFQAWCELSTGAAGTDQIHAQILTTDDTFTIPTDMSATSGMFRIKGRAVIGATAGDIQLRVDTDAADSITVEKGVMRWGQLACAA